jgi:hypothetical protein
MPRLFYGECVGAGGSLVDGGRPERLETMDAGAPLEPAGLMELMARAGTRETTPTMAPA